MFITTEPREEGKRHRNAALPPGGCGSFLSGTCSSRGHLGFGCLRRGMCSGSELEDLAPGQSRHQTRAPPSPGCPGLPLPRSSGLGAGSRGLAFWPWPLADLARLSEASQLTKGDGEFPRGLAAAQHYVLSDWQLGRRSAPGRSGGTLGPHRGRFVLPSRPPVKAT